MRALSSLVVSVALLGACNESTLGTFDTPPAVSIVAPADGEVVEPGALVEFLGVANDDKGATSLQVSWTSSIDGKIAEGLIPDSDGDVQFATSSLTGGEHAITLTALDLGGNSTTATIGLTIGFEEGEVGAPVVTLVGPVAGEEYLIDNEVLIVGTAADDEDDVTTLACTVSSSRNGIIWQGNPDAVGGISVATTTLKPGDHSLTLSCTDSDAQIGTATVNNITVLNDGRPYVTILEPAANATFWVTDTVIYRGTVRDDEQDAITLTTWWTSDKILETLPQTGPDQAGFSVGSYLFPEGINTLTFYAMDSDFKQASETRTIEIRDPLNVDQDGDGFTPNQGDCDDGNDLMNPNAADVCDTLDNDCDGYINDPFADGFEQDLSGNWAFNDTYYTSSNLGESGSILYSSDFISLTGTLHHKDDKDWYHVDPADFSLFNFCSSDIYAIVIGPTAAEYKIEIYEEGTIKQSDIGYGIATVSVPGQSGLLGCILQIFDDFPEYDVVVSAASYPTSSTAACGTNYELKIKTGP